MLDARTATWTDVKAAIQRGCVALIAFGAQEQHGPHAPLATDTIMAAGLATRLAERIDGLLLPPIPYGEAWNNSRFPGTVSISPQTAQALITDIALSLKNSGVKALIVVNGHFGNRAPIEKACNVLKKEHSFPMLQLDYPGFQELAARICESKPVQYGLYHADEVETSMVLALEPETIKMERAAAEYPVFPDNFLTEPVYLDSFNTSGVFGDPRPATAEKGEILLQGLTDAAMQVIESFLKGIE